MPLSRANGPGARSVLWVQGCPIRCAGCFNARTHDPTGGQLVSVDSILQRVVEAKDTVQGVTITGGEPLEQVQPLTELLTGVREKTNLSVLLLTGYTWQQLTTLPGATTLVSLTDLLLAGPYQIQHHLGAGLRGSANKTAHFISERYSPQDLEELPGAEIVIDTDGTIIATGVDPVRVRA